MTLIKCPDKYCMQNLDGYCIADEIELKFVSVYDEDGEGMSDYLECTCWGTTR